MLAAAGSSAATATVGPDRRNGGQRRSLTPTVDPSCIDPLSGLLVRNGCDLSLWPFGSVAARRCYRSPCGCRLRPVDAATVERLTYDALDQRGLVSAGGNTAVWLALFGSALAQVRVGAAREELVFIWRV